MTGQNDTLDHMSLLEVQSILSSWRRAELQPGDEKLLSFIVTGSGADLEVTARALTIRYDWHPSRHKYFASAAPGVVSKLLEWCEARLVTEPLPIASLGSEYRAPEYFSNELNRAKPSTFGSSPAPWSNHDSSCRFRSGYAARKRTTSSSSCRAADGDSGAAPLLSTLRPIGTVLP